MKVVFTMEEVRDILRERVGLTISLVGKSEWDVRFMHKYPDGSGEAEIEILGQIDRVEIDTK